MNWGDRAAEQHEKDQPSIALPFVVGAGQAIREATRREQRARRSEVLAEEVCSFCGASGVTIGIGDDGMCINVYKCQERHDLREKQ